MIICSKDFGLVDERLNYPLLLKYCRPKARPKINKGTRNCKILIVNPGDWFCWGGGLWFCLTGTAGLSKLPM